VLYLDPPYEGTVGYVDTFHMLDEVIAGKKIDKEESRGRQSDSLALMRWVLDRARHIPLWVLSHGSTAGVERLESVMRGMGRKEVEVVGISYKGRPYGSLYADKGKRERDVEYLVMGIK